MGPAGFLGLATLLDGRVECDPGDGDLTAIERIRSLSTDEFDSLSTPPLRRPTRYVVSVADASAALDDIASWPSARVLTRSGQRWFRLRSTHFDTADLTFYRAALHRRQDRTKVLIRDDIDVDRSFVEVTACGRAGRPTTRRIEIDPAHGGRLDVAARRFVDTVLRDIGLARHLRPTARSSSLRSTVVDRSDLSRATLDVDYRCDETRPDGTRRTSVLDGVIVESATTSRRARLDEHLRCRGVRTDRLTRSADVSLELRFEAG